MSESDLSRTFCFKTSEEYFWKERGDMKNNTIRKIDLNDVRFRELIAWAEISWNVGDIKIKISKADESGVFFERDIRDITIWNDLMIITWIPDKESRWNKK